MVEINKFEAEELRKNVPGVHIRKTVNKLYAEETVDVLKNLPNNEYAAQVLAEITRDSHVNKYQHA